MRSFKGQSDTVATFQLISYSSFKNILLQLTTIYINKCCKVNRFLKNSKIWNQCLFKCLTFLAWPWIKASIIIFVVIVDFQFRKMFVIFRTFQFFEDSCPNFFIYITNKQTKIYTFPSFLYQVDQNEFTFHKWRVTTEKIAHFLTFLI